MTQKKRLGEIALLQRGLTYNKGDEVPASSKIVLRSNNIDLESQSLDLSELKYLREDFDIPEDRKVKKDSIFICMSNGSKQHVGKVAFIDRDMDYAFGGFMGLIVPKPSISAKYVFYACNSSSYRTFLSQIGNGIGITNLRFSELEKFEIPVPSIEYQQRIVDELDLLTSIIDKKNAQLRDLDALAQSIFYEMFGDPVLNDKRWPTKSLKSVCDVRDGTHDSPKYLEKSDYVLITSKNIVGNQIDYNKASHISQSDYDAINKRSKVDEGDIIMAMIGTIGKPVIVHLTEQKFCVKNVALIKFPDSSEVTNYYIRALLNTKSYSDYIMSLNKGGTQKFVALGTLRSLPIPVPNKQSLSLFTHRIQEIEKQSQMIIESLSDLSKLLNSRMAFYFQE